MVRPRPAKPLFIGSNPIGTSKGKCFMEKVSLSKKRLITSALPYVNNEPHLGNLIQILSADAFARFCRIKGYDVFYVCGTDEYGTATETKALEERTSSFKLCSKYHQLHKDIYSFFDVSFDNFSRTSGALHTQITQDIFRKAYENGYITREKTEQFYCPKCQRFLADRFIKGECPHCSHPADGDQCDACGALIETKELKNPTCTICGSTPHLKETENLSIDLPKLREKLEEFVSAAEREGRWANNAVQIARSWLSDGLRARSITRDLKWGIKVPLKGFEDKVFYVWFDAPIGYISLTAMKLKDSWKDWWMNPDNVNLYHFIGKDNIPFHAVIFPATMFATGQNWTMVHSLSSSEYLKFEGGKFSKSRGVGVFGSDCKGTGIPSDLWRFYLYYNRPEKSDSDFSFSDFQDRINSEVVGNFSNLVNRTFVFLSKEYNSTITSNIYDEAFYASIRKKVDEYDGHFEKIELRDALRTVFEISDMANKYFQDSQIWKVVKEDRNKGAVIMATLVRVIRDMAVLVYPFMPRTSENILNTIYPYSKTNADYSLLGADITSGARIGEFSHLFDRIEDEKIAKLKKQFTAASEEIREGNSMNSEELKEFAKKVNLKVSKIVNVEKHPEGDKLYILKLDTAEGEERTIVSSIVPYYKPEELLGRNIVLVSNLKPANFRGVKSYGMLLAASDKNDDSHSTCEVIFADDIEVGTSLFPEGEDIAAAEYGVYVKPDKFFAFPLCTVAGNVSLYGKKIVSQDGKSLSVSKYTNGNVG